MNLGREATRHDHVHVMPFGVSCTKGEEESRATYFYDHIIELTFAFVVEQV